MIQIILDNDKVGEEEEIENHPSSTLEKFLQRLQQQQQQDLTTFWTCCCRPTTTTTASWKSKCHWCRHKQRHYQQYKNTDSINYYFRYQFFSTTSHIYGWKYNNRKTRHLLQSRTMTSLPGLPVPHSDF
jgi:hypothetical protein